MGQKGVIASGNRRADHFWDFNKHSRLIQLFTCVFSSKINQIKQKIDSNLFTVREKWALMQMTKRTTPCEDLLCLLLCWLYCECSQMCSSLHLSFSDNKQVMSHISSLVIPRSPLNISDLQRKIPPQLRPDLFDSYCSGQRKQTAWQHKPDLLGSALAEVTTAFTVVVLALSDAGSDFSL